MSDQASFWDQRYTEPGFAFGAAPNVFLASQRHRLAKGMRALVPGDGEGRNGVWLAEQGLSVDTIDVSPKGVEKARALAAERGVTINASVADLTTWDWPVGVYDVLASIYLHFDNAASPPMHARMLASLKPGGIVILEAYNPQHRTFQKAGSVGGPQDVAMLMSADRLRRDFHDAEIVLLEEAEITLAEGNRHTGRSSVTRLIAKKR